MGASRPIPLFNLGRQDLPWVVLLSVLCASVALIVRGGQGAHPEGRHAWKDLLVIVGSLGAFVLCGLAFIKLVHSYFHEPLDGVLFQGYTQLEDGAGTPPATVQTQEVKPQAAAARPPTRVTEPQISRPVSEAAPSGRSYRASYSPREEEDIECGLLLEASAVDFEYNGGRHQKGSLRVIKVERDGVCERMGAVENEKDVSSPGTVLCVVRQGACIVGDVLVAVDGSQVAGMHPNKVKALMRGKAGTSIILGLYTDQSREIINRHVVLAPSPSAISLTPRDSLASRRSYRDN